MTIRDTMWTVHNTAGSRDARSKATMSVWARVKRCDDAHFECGKIALEFLDLVVDSGTDQDL